jgi:DNA modification methylase
MIQEIDNKIESYQKRIKLLQAEKNEKLFELKKEKVKVLNQTITDKWSLYNGDSVEVLSAIPSNSIHYSIFSPPFSSLFVYSDSNRDMGNNDDSSFYKNFLFLLPDLYRIMMPGRLLSFHCSDIPSMKERDGFIGLKDFPGMLLKLFEDAGFYYHSKVMIKKNELAEAVRTHSIGLAHKQVVKDSAMSRNATPDYIITVRKPGENPEPINKKNGFEKYIGEMDEPKGQRNEKQKLNKYSQGIWQRYASSVWFDINQSDTLNFRAARDKADERHICPLQLQVIARCLELWSNPGDIVLSPFAGIGSEGYESIKMDRKFIGVELKESYYLSAIKNLKLAEKQQKGIL